MPSHIDDLVRRIADLERELEGEFERARERWRYRIDQGRVRFERDARMAHRRLKQDLWISIYQRICFPIYGIAHVPRSVYIVVDRHHLAYLNSIEKLNCMYCSYANGVFGYVREIAGRTEQYWCPIRHAKRIRNPHAHYHEFVEFGDAKGYQNRLPLLRAELKAKQTGRDR